MVCGGSCGEHAPRTDGESAYAVAVKVERRPEEVPSRRLHLAYPFPTLQYPRHRLLGDLLGLEPVAGEQEEGLAQSLIFRREDDSNASASVEGDSAPMRTLCCLMNMNPSDASSITSAAADSSDDLEASTSEEVAQGAL